MEDIFSPDYLSDIQNVNHFYGSLSYEEDTNCWLIEGEPIVCQTAKRIFPGCDGRGRNKARFQSTKRTVGDLNWLMLRYPLNIKDRKKWNEVLNETKEHVLNRERINKYPEKLSPSSVHFTGQLIDFQQEGLGFLLQNRRTLLADQMGLGKTIQFLSFVAKTNAYPVIIVVPNHLITNWLKEIPKFLKVDVPVGSNMSIFNEETQPRVHVIKGLKPYKLPEADIYIIHYLILRGWKHELPKYKFPTLAFDEIQELRHAHSEKYSAASLLSESCDNVIGLSGTPIYNHGAEIWNVMNIIEYQCLGDWESFTREWCYGYGNDIVVDPETLGEYLKREGLLLRRTKDQVLKELPAKRRIVQNIDSDEKMYNNLILETMDKVRSLDNIQNIFQRGRAIRDVINDTRQATGIAKAVSVCDFVKMLLESDEKVLLFGFHHAVFDIYAEELKDYNPQFITGREKQKEKDLAVEKFMNGESNICCISLRAATGLNLQRASVVVNGELDWSPAIHEQAEDRAHRIGIVDSVLCYYLVASAGSDEHIQEALGLKVSQFTSLMGDVKPTKEDKVLAQAAAKEHMNKLIEHLKRKAG